MWNYCTIFKNNDSTAVEDPDPEIRGEVVSKKLFRPFGPHFGQKIRGGGPSPGSAKALSHSLAIRGKGCFNTWNKINRNLQNKKNWYCIFHYYNPCTFTICYSSVFAIVTSRKGFCINTNLAVSILVWLFYFITAYHWQQQQTEKNMCLKLIYKKWFYLSKSIGVCLRGG